MTIKAQNNNLIFQPGDLLLAAQSFKVLSPEKNVYNSVIYEVSKGEILLYLYKTKEKAPEVFSQFFNSVNTVHYLYYNEKIVRLFDATIQRYFLRECLEKIDYGTQI
jgi:hypothetical protein